MFTASPFDDIKISLGSLRESAQDSSLMTGNLLPLLYEVRHALEQLRDTGAASVIDLAALPFGPGDREALLGFLGQGEVKAQVQALGDTRVWESRFPGVWLVAYHGPDGAELGLQLEICQTPRLLATPEDDLGDALAALTEQLKGFSQNSSAS